MDYFPQKAYYDHSRQWMFTYHGNFKVLTVKDGYVKYFLHQYSTESLEYAYNDYYLVILGTRVRTGVDKRV